MKRPLGFLDGLGVGIGGLAMLPLLYFLITHGRFLDMYKQMGPKSKLPGLTIFVLTNPVWTYGVPILLGLGFAFAIWKRPTPWLLFAVGAVAFVAVIVSYYGAYLPIWQVAGNIE